MKVVIVGGGFGGLKLARKLNNKRGLEIILIDRINYHQFQPLFYQVATAGLDASNISFPLRKVFHYSKNVRVRVSELVKVIPPENKVITSNEEIDYDILVLAMGAGTNFFENALLSENTFPMKTTVEALKIRHRLIQNFEDALTEKNELEKERLLNIVVVGGGPTGVELSGALAEMKKYVLPKDYPELDFSGMNIYLLEGMGKTLGAMSEQSSERSERYLKNLGVKVLTKTLLKDYDGKNVKLQNGTIIPSALVIWAAGIIGNIPEGIDPSLIAKGNRIKVNKQCRVAGFENIYAIGDLAFMETSTYPDGHPQVAPVAIQQAKLVAKNLKIRERNSSRIFDFEYRNKGTMATVGRHLAVVDIPRPKLHLGGFIAWMIWMGLHLMLILGVKNRFFVFVNWLYNYITYDQNLRLNFKEFTRPKK